MKKFFVLAMFLTGVCFLNAQDGAANAASIMNSARNRIKSDTMSTRSRMVISAKDGSTTEQVIDQYSKDGPNGARTMIVFQSPASVKGSRFLTMDAASGGSDRWIFLPTLGKVRRIAASESGGSFMGTDFSYDDISLIGRKVDLDTHTILREETLNGNACYVIQSVPKDSSYQYSKSISWVEKSRFLTYKSEMYNRKGDLIKVMEMSGYKDVQGRLTPMQTKISTVGAGTSTTIYLDIVKYDDQIPEAVFTTAYLETGKVK
jgi:outer membrane lipoprotein-sorting protein